MLCTIWKSKNCFKSQFFEHQNVPLSITNLFVRDHKKVSLITKLFVLKQAPFFFVIYYKHFCYCNIGMQECFAINFGTGCLCDGCLWLITEVYDKSQKRPKLITKNVRKFLSLSHCPRDTQWLITECETLSLAPMILTLKFAIILNTGSQQGSDLTLTYSD